MVLEKPTSNNKQSALEKAGTIKEIQKVETEEEKILRQKALDDKYLVNKETLDRAKEERGTTQDSAKLEEDIRKMEEGLEETYEKTTEGKAEKVRQEKEKVEQERKRQKQEAIPELKKEVKNLVEKVLKKQDLEVGRISENIEKLQLSRSLGDFLHMKGRVEDMIKNFREENDYGWRTRRAEELSEKSIDEKIEELGLSNQERVEIFDRLDEVRNSSIIKASRLQKEYDNMVKKINKDLEDINEETRRYDELPTFKALFTRKPMNPNKYFEKMRKKYSKESGYKY